eukprot:gene18050-25310_t
MDLTNAFASNRIAHAFMLTGVRGVGKTTTARLIARALNYQTATLDRPSIQLDPLGSQCEAITRGNHPDVFELDAASRTGVGDMRELLDGVRYGTRSRSRARPSTSNTRSLMATPVEVAAGCEGWGSAGRTSAVLGSRALT